jgi:DNA-binding LacI/PurR family transcriptional regulator
MKPACPPRTSSRVGLREIAERAGVSLMTVSLSLRNSPKISLAMRQRIAALADTMGYRPDPQISLLMRHLRRTRAHAIQSFVGLVHLGIEELPREGDRATAFRAAVVKRADALGFGVAEFHAGVAGASLPAILKVVRARGISGLILTARGAVSLDPALDWSRLSVVAASDEVVWPRFHQVSPNHSANALHLLDALRARGYRKVGLVGPREGGVPAAQHFLHPLAWHSEPPVRLVVPAQFSESAYARLLKPWLKKHRPDVIITELPGPVSRLLAHALHHRVPDDLGVVGVGLASADGIAHQEQRPDLIGENAMDLVADMILENEQGIPTHRRTILIDGGFRAGQSLRPLAAVA